MKLYMELRGEMVANGIEQTDIAAALGVTRCHVSQMMTGNAQWRIDQMYRVLDILDLPDEDIGRIFPRDGIRKRKKTTLRAV